MVVTFSGMLMEVREEQSANALSYIYVTPSGIMTVFKEVQPLKVLSPIYAIFSDKVTEISPEQF